MGWEETYKGFMTLNFDEAIKTMQKLKELQQRLRDFKERHNTEPVAIIFNSKYMLPWKSFKNDMLDARNVFEYFKYSPCTEEFEVF